MNFLSTYSNPTATGFAHTLTITGTDSEVWYLSVRYFVISLQLLPDTFQAGLINANSIRSLIKPRLSTAKQEPTELKHYPTPGINCLST